MKKTILFLTALVAVAFASPVAQAQEVKTMRLMKDGKAIFEKPVTYVDSIIFGLSHDVVLSASNTTYTNADIFANQMASRDGAGFITFCIGNNSPQLVYNVILEEEGDLTISTGDDICEIYVASSVANANACVYVENKSNQSGINTATTLHLLPLSDNKPYLVVITPKNAQYDAATYQYSVNMSFVPRVIVEEIPENGIKVAGTIWSISNSVYDYDNNEVVFADSPDGGDVLWQFNQDKPAAADNWFAPSPYYDGRTNESMSNPTYIACPDGWTLPTTSQISALIDAGYTVVAKDTKGAINNGGIFFGANHSSATISDPQGCLFLPFVGYIGEGEWGSGYSSIPSIAGFGNPLESHYTLKNIQYSDGPYYLIIKSNSDAPNSSQNWSRPWRAQAVRCVKIPD